MIRNAHLAVLATALLLNRSHAELPQPTSLALVNSKSIFLADRRLPGIWHLQDGSLRHYFRALEKYGTPLNAVRCVALDRQGRLLAGDSATREIYRFDERAQPRPLTRPSGSGRAEEFTPGRVGIPMDIAVNRTGEIYVADLEIGRILKLPPNGGTPVEVARIAGCRGMFADRHDQLWVVSTTSDQLHRISADGKVEVLVKGRPFKFPHAVAVNDQGQAFVCDSYAQAIWKVEPQGASQVWCQDDAFVRPTGIEIVESTLYVADPGARAVFRIDASARLHRLEFKTQPE